MAIEVWAGTSCKWIYIFLWFFLCVIELLPYAEIANCGVKWDCKVPGTSSLGTGHIIWYPNEKLYQFVRVYWTPEIDFHHINWHEAWAIAYVLLFLLDRVFLNHWMHSSRRVDSMLDSWVLSYLLAETWGLCTWCYPHVADSAWKGWSYWLQIASGICYQPIVFRHAREGPVAGLMQFSLQTIKQVERNRASFWRSPLKIWVLVFRPCAASVRYWPCSWYNHEENRAGKSQSWLK